MRFDVSALPRRAPAPAHPLAAILAAAGVTIADAGRLLNCSRPWLSACLNGRANPGRRLARKMAELTAALVAEQAEGVRRA